MHPYLNTAIKIAKSAGKIIIQATNRLHNITINTKNHLNDYVTSVDMEVERFIINNIQMAYPNHQILGEEYGEQVLQEAAEQTQVRWIVDPINGTNNFIHGLPFFCVSISIEINGILVYGVIYAPLLNELFCASKGKGAMLNDRRIRTSENYQFSQSILGLEPMSKTLSKHKLMDKIAKFSGVRMFGSPALALAYVAVGKLTIYYADNLKAWEMSAGVLMVREAGGIITDHANKHDYLNSGNILAANPKLHNKCLPIFIDLNE